MRGIWARVFQVEEQDMGGSGSMIPGIFQGLPDTEFLEHRIEGKGKAVGETIANTDIKLIMCQVMPYPLYGSYTHLILNSMKQVLLLSPFTGKKTEVQRGKVVCLSHADSKWQNQYSKLAQCLAP